MTKSLRESEKSPLSKADQTSSNKGFLTKKTLKSKNTIRHAADNKKIEELEQKLLQL